VTVWSHPWFHPLTAIIALTGSFAFGVLVGQRESKRQIEDLEMVLRVAVDREAAGLPLGPIWLNTARAMPW
jgi:hypothetical protein